MSSIPPQLMQQQIVQQPFVQQLLQQHMPSPTMTGPTFGAGMGRPALPPAGGTTGPFPRPQGPMYGPPISQGPVGASGGGSFSAPGQAAGVAGDTTMRQRMAAQLRGLPGRVGVGGAASAGGAAGFYQQAGGLSGIAKTGATRALPIYMGTQFAGSLIPETQGRGDNIARGVVERGGQGAALGSFLGPKGTLIGGGIGATFGALEGIFSSGDTAEKKFYKEAEKQTNKISGLLDDTRMLESTRSSLMEEYNMGLRMIQEGVTPLPGMEATSPHRLVREFTDKIVQQFPQIQEMDKMERAYMQQQQEQEQALMVDMRQRQAAAMAMQAWLGPMLEDIVGQSDIYANQLSETLLDQAQHIRNPRLRAEEESRARQLPLDQASQSAYMMQSLMLTPQVYGFNTPVDPQTGFHQVDPMAVMGAQPYQMSPGMGVAPRFPTAQDGMMPPMMPSAMMPGVMSMAGGGMAPMGGGMPGAPGAVDPYANQELLQQIMAAQLGG